MNVSTNITSGTVYFTFQNTNGDYWNGSSYEAYNGANWTTYDVAATTEGAGVYSVSVPASATDYQLRLQAGGSPATTDAVVDAGATGVSIMSLAANSITASALASDAVAEIAAAISAGASAADIWAYATRTLTGGVATYTGPVDPNTNAVAFVAGDAVTLTWTASTTSFTTIQNGDATAIRFLPTAKYRRDGASAAAELQKTGTASISGSTITFTFTLSTSESDDLTTVYPSSNAPTHQVQVICTARDVTVVNAEATINRRIAAPS